MAQNALIQVRIDGETKREADALFTNLGFDTPTAIRMFLKQAVSQQRLPFDVAMPVPNEETRAAMEAARSGKGLAGPFRDVKELMASLEEGDDG